MICSVKGAGRLAVSAILLFPALAGCRSNDSAATITAPASVEKQKEDIQNNPNMPPQAKAAALAALQRNPTKGSLPGPQAPQAPQAPPAAQSK